jgi:hypothetical protein
LYVRIAVPYIAPESLSDGSKPNSKGLGEFLSPLRVLAPQKVFLESGMVRNHYGVLFLCAGVFLGVVSPINHVLPCSAPDKTLIYSSWQLDTPPCSSRCLRRRYLSSSRATMAC